MNSIVQRKETFRKETDHVTRFRCAGGIGILREEVWVNARGEVVRYNLAFLLPHLLKKTMAASLGMTTPMASMKGVVQKARFKDYPSTAARFYREVASIRRRYENESI
jgi:hypothetical protein